MIRSTLSPNKYVRVIVMPIDGEQRVKLSLPMLSKRVCNFNSSNVKSVKKDRLTQNNW